MLYQMRIDSYQTLSRSALRSILLLPPRHEDEPYLRKQCSAVDWFSDISSNIFTVQKIYTE
jgi:hypothetical protein